MKDGSMGLFGTRITRLLQRGETSVLYSGGGLTVLGTVGVIRTDRAVVDLLGDNDVPLSTDVSLHDPVSTVGSRVGAHEVTRMKPDPVTSASGWFGVLPKVRRLGKRKTPWEIRCPNAF